MDHAQISHLAENHGAAVVAHDDKTILSDIIAELHPLIPQLAAALPNPVVGSRLVSADVFDDHAETVTEYSGPAATIAVRARWEDRGSGRPQIVSASTI